jgi:hypothetical protein
VVFFASEEDKLLLVLPSSSLGLPATVVALFLGGGGGEIIQSIAIFSVGKAGGAEGAMVVGVSSTDIIIMASEYPTTRQGAIVFIMP